MILLRTAILATLLLSAPALAQGPTTPGPHDHPQQGTQPAPATPGSAMPGAMMGGQMMGGQHGSMMGGSMMHGQMGGSGAGMSGRMGDSNRGSGAGMMGLYGLDRVEGRLAFLKTELKLTDAQLPAWTVFADQVRTNATTMSAERHAMHGRVGADVSLPDRLLAQVNAFTAHAEEMTKLKAALDPLYAGFSAEQKKIADEIVFSPMGIPVGM